MPSAPRIKIRHVFLMDLVTALGLVLTFGVPWLVLRKVCIEFWALKLLAFGFIAMIWLGLLMRLLPRLKPGRYSIPGSFQFQLWMFLFVLKRPWTHPAIQQLLMLSHGGRILYFWALRANVALNTQWASDCELRDPQCVTVQGGVSVGAGTIMGGHQVHQGKIEIGFILIEENAEIGAECRIGPSVRIGSATLVGMKTEIGPDVQVGSECVIGNRCLIQPGVRIGDYCVIESLSVIAPNTTIPDFTVVKASGLKL